MHIANSFSYPETRTPKQRGQNTINDLFTKLRTFFRCAVESGKTQNNPFTHFDEDMKRNLVSMLE